MVSRRLSLLAAVAAVVGFSSASFAAITVTSTRTTIGSNDVVQFIATNDGVGGTGTNLQGFDITITTSTGFLKFEDDADNDGDGTNDVNIPGYGLTLTLASAPTAVSSFMRIGSAASWDAVTTFTNVNTNVLSPNSLPYNSSANAGQADPGPLWTSVSKWRDVGTFTSAGQVASSGLKFANIVVPVGATVTLSGLISGNTGAANAVAAVNAVPEPASMGVLALGGLALLARRRKA